MFQFVLPLILLNLSNANIISKTCNLPSIHSPNLQKTSNLPIYRQKNRKLAFLICLRGGSLSSSSSEEDLNEADEVFDSDSASESFEETEGSEISAKPPSPMTGIFQMLKQMTVSALAMNLVKRLDPSKSESIRLARIIYVTYLIVYHVILAYLRVKIFKLDDTNELSIPPPDKIIQLLNRKTENISQADVSPVKDMAEKILTRKVKVKNYDISQVDSLRRQLVFTSIFMCLLHLKFGMIKPIILGAALGLWQLTEHPIFKIHILGMKSQNSLARPFKQDLSLNDWLKNKSKISEDEKVENEIEENGKISEEFFGDESKGLGDDLIGDEKSEDELLEGEESEVEIIDDEKSDDELFEDEKSEDELFEDEKSTKEIFEDEKSDDELFDGEKSNAEIVEAEKSDDIFYDEKSNKDIVEDEKSDNDIVEDEKSNNEIIEVEKSNNDIIEGEKSGNDIVEDEQSNDEPNDKANNNLAEDENSNESIYRKERNIKK